MEKMFPKNCIALDGRLDEAVWDEVAAGTGFTTRKILGGEEVKDQTIVKIIPCEDRVYFGIQCNDPNMEFAKNWHAKTVYTGNSLEIFISPSGSISQIYNFALTMDGLSQTVCFVEGGANREIYHPDWKRAIYIGEDFWSAEVEIPYSAFYHTPNEMWSDVWLVNVIRNQPSPESYGDKKVFTCSTWSKIDKSFLEVSNYRHLTDMPIRPLRNDIKFTGLSLNLNEATDNGYCGTMDVAIVCAAADAFAFTSDFSKPVDVVLQPGANTITVPCCVKELIRHNLSMELKRADDGEVFKFYHPVTAEFEPIRIFFNLPEYRTNFYPGQDYSKIVGKVLAAKPVTLTLEGGGMATQTVYPDAEGNFTFETPAFREGSEAILTASVDGWEIKKTMRRLAPTGHTMAWISKGRLVVNGKPILRRNVCARHYRGGEAFNRRYDADDLNETKECWSYVFTQPNWLIPGSETYNASFIGEAGQDRKPSDEMLQKLDKRLAFNSDKDYVFNYAYDEPEYHYSSLIYMRQFCEHMAEKDPYHPIMIASHDPDRYMHYCDWIETHPYLETKWTEKEGRTFGRPINTMKKYLDPMAKMNRPDKCLGFINSTFAYRYLSFDFNYPTFDELLCHSWVAINHGAKTIWSYAYHDLNDRPQLYEGTRYLFASLGALEDPVLHGRFKTLVCDENIDAVLIENGEDTIFIAANMSGMTQTVTLDSIPGTWHHFRHNRTFTGNTFRLKPYEVLIGTRLNKDRNLPTYQQTAALIDRLEAERLSNKSLLFGREADLEGTFSGGKTIYKLFDGVRDNLACELKGKDLFLEVDLTKVKPTFSKVVLSGWHLEDAELKLRVNGELVTVVPAELHNEEFSATYILSEPVCPDALRFEFPQEYVELYELEVF